ncbi:hypothetical protein [Erwinia psidii]|nr:hypothetical protein [Erwinia psidii]MCX8956361.1 hypothetical protein [Erwinia psidii]MCX8959881.1 hypothetical protein [Erwinia psidii]
MSQFLRPAAAYLSRRNELLAERSAVTSAEVIQTINKALLASEVAMAACYDLDVLHGLQQRKTRHADGHERKHQRELRQFERQAEHLTLAEEHDESAFIAWQKGFSALIASFPWQHASPALMQNELFAITVTLWQEALEALFTSSDQRPQFKRAEKIVAFSISKIPLLGEATEVWRALMDLLDACRQRSAREPVWFTLLESYSEAANLCSRGILLFCLASEAVLRGQPLPDRARLNERIKRHYDSVIDGTHPFFDR